MKKGIIVGKEESRWTKAGETEQRVSRTLHVLWDPPKKAEDALDGRRVEAVRCSFDISDIPVGAYCQFDFDIRNSAKGSYAVLSDVEVLRSYNIVLEEI